MKKVGGLLAVVIALAIGYYMFKTQFEHLPGGGVPPKETIDVVGVRNDLLAIAQAERMYLASHGSYATLDQLQQDGSLAFATANRRGYNYTASVDNGQHFTVTAAPADPAKSGWPTLSIDESMEVTQK